MIRLISLTTDELREIKLSDLRDGEIERCRDESLTASIIARDSACRNESFVVSGINFYAMYLS